MQRPFQSVTLLFVFIVVVFCGGRLCSVRPASVLGGRECVVNAACAPPVSLHGSSERSQILP